MDSIANGADDDGSGSMAMLEIAEAIQRAPVKPKRSILFVWHTAEEDGLVGSRWFSDNPTVPITSIVAQINMDMIGRGRAEDVPGGGPDYLGIVGANRLSSELGARVAAINAKQSKPLKLDDRFDRTISWGGYNNIYGRSDHANYARYNIPIVFFFTGLHGDYHQVTDEPQYIDFPHYARITQYVHDLTVDVANLNKRPVVDRSGAPPRVITP
jgi:Zn-dependent M28 family amino/carboxypeptidase